MKVQVIYILQMLEQMQELELLDNDARITFGNYTTTARDALVGVLNGEV